MGLDTFPEIESFQKLPRQVIVKGGSSSFDKIKGAELRGIVINNTGHSIQNVSVHVVIFDEDKIPVLSAGTEADPDLLSQGGIANFTFELKECSQEIKDYHLYANWRFDDRA